MAIKSAGSDADERFRARGKAFRAGKSRCRARLSQGGHDSIVWVLDYEIFDDPFTQQELYALVMEYVEGMSLAQYLARRREASNPLKINEAKKVMDSRCAFPRGTRYGKGCITAT